MSKLTNYKKIPKKNQKKQKSNAHLLAKVLPKDKQKGIAEIPKEGEQKEEEDIKELIEQIKLLNKVMEYCAKNPQRMRMRL